MTNIDSKLFLNVRFINYLEILNCLMLCYYICNEFMRNKLNIEKKQPEPSISRNDYFKTRIERITLHAGCAIVRCAQLSARNKI